MATQSEQIAELKAQVEKLTSALATSGKPVRTGPVPAEQASKDVQAAHSKTPKTYIALEAGIDHKQGLVPAGTTFATTQPQGSWMEEVKG